MSKKQAICKVSKMPAKKGKGIDPTYYENHCFADDMVEAEKQGNLIVTRKGENALQSIKRHLAEKAAEKKKLNKTESVSIRLPLYVVNLAKAEAKRAGVPYTSFMGGVIERAMANPAQHLA